MSNNPPNRVCLKRVTLNYAKDLFDASAFEEGGVKKYTGTFTFDPNTKAGKRLIALCEDAIDAAIEKRYDGKKAPDWRAGKMKNDCFFDGNDKDNPDFADKWVVIAKNEKRPSLFDMDKEPTTKADGRIQSTDLVDAIVEYYVPKAEQYKNRICCSLLAVKLVEEGPRDIGGGRPVTADDFDDDEEYERPARKKPSRRDDDEEEDERPARKKPSRRDDDDEEDERPARKKPSRRDDDEEEDERPARKKPSRRDEDDEDERPARKKPSRRDDDEEEDERPARKKPSRRQADDDDDDFT